jgi:hypothetical protein
MNLALYSSESAGNKDLMRSVRRTITTELQKLLEAKRPPNRNNYFGTFQWNRVKSIKSNIYSNKIFLFFS